MSTQRTFQAKRVALAALVGGAAAATANVACVLIARALGVDFVIQPSPDAPATPIGIGNFVGASFVPAFVAAGVLLLLDRFTSKPARVFGIIAVAVALLSLAGPLTVAGASAGTRMALVVSHLLSAVAISGALVRIGRQRET
jgi:hypothetical protein